MTVSRLLWLPFALVCFAFASHAAGPPEPTRTPLVRTVDLNVGERQQVVLCDGQTATVKLLDLKEHRDSVRQAVRRGVVTVEVNGQRTELVAATYHLPTSIGGVLIDCAVTKGYTEASSKKNVWGLLKDARLRLWPPTSPLVLPDTFSYPVKQKWFASDTQMANVPVFVDGGESPSRKSTYYHYGLDFGGVEGMVDVVAATDGLVVSAAGKTLPGYEATPVAPRYDVVYILDDRGWYYRYSHMQSIEKEVVPGAKVARRQKIGVLGKEGGSGGWSHLHFDIKSRQPSGLWGTQAAYGFVWETYQYEYDPKIIPVARPHQLIWTGETATLDGSKSWAWGGGEVTCEWLLGPGVRANGPRMEKRYDKAGTYSEVLKVTDVKGNVAYDFQVVQVIDREKPEPPPPTIHAAYSPTFNIYPGDPVTFKVRTFRSTGGETWDFGDGSPSVKTRSDGNANVHAKDGYGVTTHRFQKPGDYIVRVEHMAAGGATAEAHLHVQVKQRPNVIFVLTDDQGYGDLSCHGNPVLKTPYLDQLAKESVRFTDFHVSPMCTPTRSELMTGRDALANGAYCACSGRTFIRRDLPTMAEVFADSGYRTGIFGKWHLGDNYPHRPQDRGFQEAVYHLGWGITSTPDYWNNDYFDDYFRHNGQVKKFPGYCTDVWFSEATKWIKTCQEKGEPFFAYISTNAPHGPFFAPEKYKQPYTSLDDDTAGFFAMIANIDENMARLDAMLEQTGIKDNTILIFMTDNGGTGGIKVYNAGMRGAKASLYEGGHRVPFFLRWPAGRFIRYAEVDALTHGQDLLPTLIDLCGLKKPEGAQFDGVSLADLLGGRSQPELSQRMLVTQYGGLVQTHPQKWDATVMWNEWRLVKGKELYNTKTDPGQKNDVAAAQPGVVAKMRVHYEQWWGRIEPTLSDFVPIGIGCDRENPACLTSLDWLAPTLVIAAQPFDVRLLGKTQVVEGSLPLGRPSPVLNCPWYVQVEQEGRYEISLRRWPVEADAEITAALPEYKGVDGTFPAGLAVPAVKARLKIGDTDVTQDVAPGAKAVTFGVELKAGKTNLQTWFYDAEGKELCGAFYVYVHKK